MSEKDPAGDGWHLDKRVPVVLIVTLVTAITIGVWRSAELSTAVAENTDDIAELKDERRKEREDVQRLLVEMAELRVTILERFSAIQSTLDDVQADVRRAKEISQ